MPQSRFKPKKRLFINKSVSPVYYNFMFDWFYKQYLLVGGYGSGKSYHIAFKIICKLLTEKRKALVVREVFDTILDSCYDLMAEILQDLNMYTDDISEWRKNPNLVLCQKSPLRIKFHNGSMIIFKGMDKPAKVKSINGVSIVWLEECSEIKYDGYKELLGRLRTPDVSLHFILSCNPVGKENWVFRHFFESEDEKGKIKKIVDEEEFYSKKLLIKNNTYYMHTVPEDNIFLPKEYLRTLEEIKLYDKALYRVAKLGRFGANGLRVLPQLTIAESPAVFKSSIEALGDENKYFGFDFGFEKSYNAVVSMAVDLKNGILYIYDEIYQNHITDNDFAQLPEMQKLKSKLDDMANRGIHKQLIADNEDPKAIRYYQDVGFRIRECKNKFKGSRLSNTRKIKRFKHIIVSPKCKNVKRELKDLTYKKDRNGNTIYDEFNIDPHTFSAIWYALDKVTVADVKDKKFNSRRG